MKPEEPRPEDPSRDNLQPPIPTHPPDPMAKGEAEKIVGGPPLSGRDPDEPPLVDTGIGSGLPFDHVGGAGLGKLPGEGEPGETPATTRDRDTKVP